MDQERTYKWIQDRLRDLHSGTLNETDRARLIELSKDDPFLKDALEGYQSTHGHDHIQRLRTISHHIQSRHTARRRKLFPSRSQWVIQAAAAALLLLFVTWAAIYYVGKENTEVFATAKTEDATSTDTLIDITSGAQDIDADIAYDQPAELLQEEPGLRANAQAKYEAKDKTEAEAKDNNLSSQNMKSTVADATQIEEASPSGVLSEPVTTGKTSEYESDGIEYSMTKDEGSFANAMPPSMVEQRVTGQIINSYGQPVTGAVISIPNSNLITTSDTYGQFEIFIPGAKSPVEISSSGYQDTLMNVNKGQENVVVVLSSAYPHQGEVAYQKMEAQKARVNTTSLDKTLSFHEYLKANSIYPVQSQYTSNNHPVTIQFTVNSEGRPEKITTVKSSVAKKFHTEAIRLVENGPLWTCDKFPCKKEYTIYFQ